MKQTYMKIIGPLYLLYLPSASVDGFLLDSKQTLDPSQQGAKTVFCDPSQRGTILYLLIKWPLWPSDTQ